MYSHFLLPTDGSPASEAAIAQGIDLARKLEARVTGLYVIPEFHIFTYRTDMLEDSRDQFAKDSVARARQYLTVIEDAARSAGVRFETTYVCSDHPYEAIVQTAAEHSCDLIVMASHGRRGLKGLLIGSETQKVLTHSKTPVLVCH